MKTLTAFWSMAVFTVVLGFAYPALMTAVAGALFPRQAEGSLVRSAGTVLGSHLVGQDWASSPQWLQGRPSATIDHPDNPLGSSGSNLSPQGLALKKVHDALRAVWSQRARDAGQTQAVPEELLAASASGLDPDLDVDAALWQAPLIAHARGVSTADVVTVLRNVARRPDPLAEDRVLINVLDANLALQAAFPERS